MAELRFAKVEDLPKLEPLAKEFYASSEVLGGFSNAFNTQRFQEIWTDLLNKRSGVILLLEHEFSGTIIGALGGVMFPEIYTGKPTATEFFFFVSKDSRGDGLKLYRAFERWARLMKCSEIRMVHLWDVMPEKVGKFYTRLGFVPTEVHYKKQLEAA
jgi:GNAT superfamily N-acetyltransferase